MSQDYIVIAAGIVFLALIVIGLIRRIRKDGIGSVMDDAVVLKVKEIFVKEIGDVLVNAGLEETYEAFKNQVVYTMLDKVREYIDKQGGLIDTITDAIDDDTIIEAIYQAIALSGMEDDIKKAYDTIITNRIKEMESYEEKVAAENAANEAAVALFLEEKISYLQITEIIEDCMKNCAFIESPKLEEVLETEKQVREMVAVRYGNA